MTSSIRHLAAAGFLIGAGQLSSQAVLIGGVEFPDGAVSFADAVVSYTPGSGVSAPYNVASKALGVPDYDPVSDDNFVSLGDIPGELVLRFVDNSLTTSGTPADDLWVFEIGGAIEPTSVDISVDGLSWIAIGDTGGATSGIDIDSIAGVVPGERYSYVRLRELRPLQSGSPFAGADIDAVGAISSGARVPDQGGAFLLAPIFAMLAFRRRSR
jgi:hypothetical protein